MNHENDFPPPAAVNGIDGIPTQSKRRKGATTSQPSTSLFLDKVNDGDDDGDDGRENSCDSEGMPHPRASNIQIRGESNDAFYEAETEAETEPDSHHQYYHLMDDGTSLLQAVVFVEDAFHYRSIHHKVDHTSLRLYRFQYSYLTTRVRYVTIFILHILAFFEYPSSLSLTSSIKTNSERLELPCGATESVEIICLVILAIDLGVKIFLVGGKQFLVNKWMIVHVFVLLVSMIDWSVSMSLNCHELIRVRRIIRPFFILQHSSLMKKIVNCLRQTLPEVISILLLLGFHLYIFTLFGMLIFPKPTSAKDYIENLTHPNLTILNTTKILPGMKEESKYFKTLSEAFTSMLVLLTTANNPDVMMPAYNQNRIYSIYFVVFLVIGLYCFMNMLTAVIYNQFRGYFLNSMQSSLFRRRVATRAAYEVLRCQNHYSSNLGVEAGTVQRVIDMADLPTSSKYKMLHKLCGHSDSYLNFSLFQEIFAILDRNYTIGKQAPEIVLFNNPSLAFIQKVVCHIYFTYFGMLVAAVNVIFLTVQLNLQYEQSMGSTHTSQMTANLVFIIYYVIEQILKVWATGLRRYYFFLGNIYDSVIAVLLVIVESITLVEFGTPFSTEKENIKRPLFLWNLIRVTNLLIVIRLIRVIPLIKTMALVSSTLLDLVQNLKAFAGILVVIFYSYALLGMEFFQGTIRYSPSNGTDLLFKDHQKCGSYQQLEYWANNFDDFAAALIVLWDVMVVNNWQVFLNVYAAATNQWSYLYFVVWWLLSVVIVLNLLTALILENFIMKWDKCNTSIRDRTDSIEETHLLSLHEMFQRSLQEPDEEKMLLELHNHSYLNLNQF